MRTRLAAILLFVTGIILSSCGGKEMVSEAAPPKEDNVKPLDTFSIGKIPFVVLPSSAEEFDKIKAPEQPDTSEANRIKKDAALVSRSGDSLLLRIGNKTIVFKSSPNGDIDEFAFYSYIGRIKNTNQFLIYGAFNEYFHYVAIDCNTGDTSFFCGAPLISPGNKYIIAANCDLYARFTPNGFDLGAIERGKVKKLDRREIDSWGPQEIKWLTDTTLLARLEVMDTAGGEIRSCTEYVKLIMKPK